MKTYGCPCPFGVPNGLEPNKEYKVVFNQNGFMRLIHNDTRYVLIYKDNQWQLFLPAVTK